MNSEALLVIVVGGILVSAEYSSDHSEEDVTEGNFFVGLAA